MRPISARRNPVSACLALVCAGAFAFVTPAAWGAPADRPAAEDTGPDPDACSLLPFVSVDAVLIADTADVRSESGHPAAGESTCAWSARSPTLTPDSPPESRLLLSWYHMGSVDKAHAQLLRIGGGETRSPLVKTDDPDDETARPRPETVVARHGRDIAVIDGQDVKNDIKESADWSYQAEKLAFQAAGARGLRPVNAWATADSCHLVDPSRLLGVLTLTPARVEGRVNGPICSISVDDATGSSDAAAASMRASAQLEVQDMGTHAYALQFEHQISPHVPVSTLVRTVDPGDRVLVDAAQPGHVYAVHGPYYATLEISDPSPAAQAHPTWAYRVQRAALEAAGTTIVPTPGLPPDPSTPNAPPARADGAPDFGSWTPPPHPAPPWSLAYEPILHILAIAARLRFFLLPAFIFLPLLFSLGGKKAEAKPSRPGRLGFILPPAIAFGVLNLIFGPSLSTRMIHAFGESGVATVTGTFGTATQYNNHDVVGFHVLIKRPSGSVFNERFEDDEFNVYPPHNVTSYPDVGTLFTVRYLPHFPRDFVILTDDASPFAQGLRCSELQKSDTEAHQRADFSKAANDLAAEARADAVLVKAGCGAS